MVSVALVASTRLAQRAVVLAARFLVTAIPDVFVWSDVSSGSHPAPADGSRGALIIVLSVFSAGLSAAAPGGPECRPGPPIGVGPVGTSLIHGDLASTDSTPLRGPGRTARVAASSIPGGLVRRPSSGPTAWLSRCAPSSSVSGHLSSRSRPSCCSIR